MLSSRRRACSSVKTGVLPRRTTCLGPRTAWAGLTARTWPTTSQSNSMRIAARCNLTVGLAAVVCTSLCSDVHRLDVGQPADLVLLDPREKVTCSPVVGHAGVLVADRRGEKFKEALGGMVAGAAITAGTSAAPGAAATVREADLETSAFMANRWGHGPATDSGCGSGRPSE